MKYFLDKNVFVAAQERISWLYDEFENIMVTVSGGKDSTVIYNLCLLEAKRRGRLPMEVVFIDQEAEWSLVIQYMRFLMNNQDVKPYWMQIPIKLFNSSSYFDQWLMCWKEGQKWLREKEEISIKENVYGTDRFKDMFEHIVKYYYPNSKCATVGGVRADESPSRNYAVTSAVTYKDASWGKVLDSRVGHYTFYPIYDWTIKDVWKAIHENGWRYCGIYDEMYQHGVPLREMRVSNLHHETALKSLGLVQELDADLWDKLTRRLEGVNSLNTMDELYFGTQKLPYMFKDWREYRDYLLENLITENKIKEKMRKKFATLDKNTVGFPRMQEDLWKVEVVTILVNDFEFTKLNNYVTTHSVVRAK